MPAAIRKGVEAAKKSMMEVPLEGGTIPHDIIGKFSASSVVLRPAPHGTGVIAGGAVRTVLELSGLKNIVAKKIGSANAINVARATLNALGALKQLETVTTAQREGNQRWTMLQLRKLRPAPGSNPKKKRVGRGTSSGLGKTCGRGHKGQTSRSGGTKGAALKAARRRFTAGCRNAVSRIIRSKRNIHLSISTDLTRSKQPPA